MITWTMQMMLKDSQERRNPASVLIITEERSMKVSIEYCVQWNYKPRAASLAAQLQKTFNAKTSLIKGGGGDFYVYVDSVLLFSKKKEGRFPNDGEVERLIKNQNWSGFLS